MYMTFMPVLEHFFMIYLAVFFFSLNNFRITDLDTTVYQGCIFLAPLRRFMDGALICSMSITI